jgi:hypothetical protein
MSPSLRETRGLVIQNSARSHPSRHLEADVTADGVAELSCRTLHVPDLEWR